MDEQITDQQALTAVTDPNTPGAVLQAIAAQHPELWPQIAAHPQAYPGLLDWLDGDGDASVKGIVAARRAGAPRLAPQPVAKRAQARPEPGRGGKPKTTLIILLCVLLVAALGIGAYLLLGKGSGPKVKITPGARAYGGSGTEQFTATAVAKDGSIIAAGETNSIGGDFPATKGAKDAVVAKISPDGALVWAKTYGGSGSDRFGAVAVAPDGSIIAVGSTDSIDGDFPDIHDSGSKDANGGLNDDAALARLTVDGSLS